MAQSVVRSVAELAAAAKSAIATLGVRADGGEVVWWRGQAPAGRPLLPRLFRPSDRARLVNPADGSPFEGPARDHINAAMDWRAADVLDNAVPQKVRATHEATTYAQFMARAQSRHPNCPGPRDYGAWLILMQHYGMRTRLLDWTESILVAAFFAVELPERGGPVSDVEIVAMNPQRLALTTSDGFISTPGCRAAQRLARAGFHHGAASAEIQPWLTHEVNSRITVQRGCFTCHGKPIPVPEAGPSGQIVTRFVVPSADRQSMMIELQLVGVTRSQLFPDLDALSRAIHLQQL